MPRLLDVPTKLLIADLPDRALVLPAESNLFEGFDPIRSEGRLSVSTLLFEHLKLAPLPFGPIR